MTAEIISNEFLAFAWALTIIQAVIVFSWIGWRVYKHFSQTKAKGQN